MANKLREELGHKQSDLTFELFSDGRHSFYNQSFLEAEIRNELSVTS